MAGADSAVGPVAARVPGVRARLLAPLLGLALLALFSLAVAVAFGSVALSPEELHAVFTGRASQSVIDSATIRHVAKGEFH